MSPNAVIPSHRKPRRSASSRALRAGVTGGILTLAVTGAALPANAAEKPVAETLEMPTVTADLVTTLAKSADAAEQAALEYERQAAQDSSTAAAAKAAAKAKAEAERKAEAEQKAEEARQAEEAKAQERASRSTERTTLTTRAASTGVSTDATASTPRSTGTGSSSSLVGFLQAQLGKSYVMGATGPSAYDCSGLVQAAYRQLGIDLPRTSQQQSTFGTQVGLGNLQVGDILYWGGAGSAYHVAVYVGNGNFIGAQNPSTGIVERPLSYSQPTGAVRVL
ncbi:NlpC/P60 family protein [Streptomyces sp. NPDC003077]|uniref:C40 family peptidase n=1 Tax=Streptomyces sp. NPDC003077 TaxID=3154443 RepID=UPI0033B689C4